MKTFIITIKAMAAFAMSVIGIFLIGVIVALIVSFAGLDEASPYAGSAVIIAGFLAILVNFLRALPTR